MKLKRLFNKHRTSELVIHRRYSSRTKLFFAALLVILLIVGSGALYTYGLTSAGFEKFTAFRQQSDLREDIKRIKDENLELRETLARAQRHRCKSACGAWRYLFGLTRNDKGALRPLCLVTCIFTFTR